MKQARQLRLAGNCRTVAGRGTKNRLRAVALVWCLLVAVLCWPQMALGAVEAPEDFVRIPAGEFWMGSPERDPERETEESPCHRVRISELYLCRHEVTVGEFRKFVDATGYRTDAEMAGDPVNWRYRTDGRVRSSGELNHPVINVSWNDAVAYCVWRSKTEGRRFALPTEAQWEYACRAGTETPFSTGGNLTTGEANYDGSYPYHGNAKGVNRATTTPVCSFAPNGWGLCDMHGNVYEWCSDWYRDGYYRECSLQGTVTDPQGIQEGGSSRVLRGGSWGDSAGGCRSASRGSLIPDARYNYVGFRLALLP